MLILYAIAPIVLLLTISALFSAAETALTAVSRGRMHQMEHEGSQAARRVNRLVADRERMIGAVLLGNTFINILTSSLTTALLEDHLGGHAVAVTTTVMTVVILIFVETLPKTLAIARTDQVALALATPLQWVVSMLAPIIRAVQWLVWRLLSLFGIGPRNPEENAEDAAHEEIRGAVALHHMEGSVEREHRDMIGGILDLRELTVADVMMHRTHMTSVDADLQPREIVEAVLDSQHTRVPLWRGEPDNIIGVLHAKHLALALIEHKGDIAASNVVGLATPPWYVPETTTLEEQLDAFRDQRTHFALVVDEYGTLQGLVTLEDILAEIFGELPDEHQAEERPDVRRRPDGSYLIDGTVTIRDLNRELDWNLPDEGATTIAGLVIHEARTIPDPGQRFAFFGYKFEVLRRQRNQITALRVTPPSKNEIFPAG
jgi:Mg2+/Co2+ transporter CorB